MKLPLRYIQCLTLGYLGLHPRDIAKALGCSEAVAKTYCSIARRAGHPIPKHTSWEKRT